MANTLNLGDGNWATKEGSLLGYNSENNNYKPLPFYFSRGSSATVVNKDGLIETVGSGEPRIDFKDNTKGALLLENSSTNLVSYSEDFSQSYWSKSNSIITSNSVISPDGSLNASSFTQSGVTAEHSIYHTLPTLTSGVKYTGSVFLKYDNWQYFQIRFRSGGFGAEIGVIYDAINKTITTTNGSLLSYKVEEYANDWVRISIVAQSTSASNYAGLVVAYNNSGNVFNDPDSVPNTGANAYIWGFQAGISSFPTSYIPTQGGAVTRLADVCNNGGNDQVFNDSEGVLYAEVKGLEEIPDLSGYITISSPSVSFTNAVVLQFRNNGDLRLYFGGNAQENIQFIDSSIDFTENNKIAVQYDSNGSNYKMFVNGVSISRYSTATNQSVTGLSELNLNYSSLRLIGELKDIRVFNNALTDQQLQALTTI